MDDIEVHGRVADDELWQRLHDADVLCAPSLGGESFGMVLTEAFAAGTPVVASDIAGYRQVVTHGRDGLLVPHGRPLELAEALRSLWLDPERRAAMGVAARARAPRTSPGRSVAEQVDGGLRAAIEAPEPGRRGERTAVKVGPAAGATCRRAARARRLPSLEPAPLPTALAPARALRRRPPRRTRPVGGARRAARVPRAAAGRLRQRRPRRSCDSSPSWVLIALGAVLDLDDPARASPGTTSCAPRCPSAR